MRIHPNLLSALFVALAASLALGSPVSAQLGDDAMQPAPPPGGEAPAPAPAQPSAPGGSADEVLDPSYLPMPGDRAGQLKSAIEAATQKLKRDSLSQCWLAKLGDAKTDDRLLEWTRVCPAFSREGLLAGRSCSVTALQQDLLLDELTDAAAVEKADATLHLAVHLRSLVVAIGTRSDVADKLASLEEDVKTAESELAKVKANSRSRHYLALRSWLEARKGDPNSLYHSCGR